MRMRHVQQKSVGSGLAPLKSESVKISSNFSGIGNNELRSFHKLSHSGRLQLEPAARFPVNPNPSRWIRSQDKVKSHRFTSQATFCWGSPDNTRSMWRFSRQTLALLWFARRTTSQRPKTSSGDPIPTAGRHGRLGIAFSSAAAEFLGQI